jgi:hypothetical protein
MDSGVLIVIGAFVVIGALAIGGSSSSIQTFGGMFRAPALGWPSGVQEDDDLQWSWSPSKAIAPARRPSSVAEPEVPELFDVDSSSHPLRLEPIHRGVR